MAQDRNRTNPNDEEVVLRVTAHEMRDQPAPNTLTPPTSQTTSAGGAAGQDLASQGVAGNLSQSSQPSQSAQPLQAAQSSQVSQPAPASQGSQWSQSAPSVSYTETSTAESGGRSWWQWGLIGAGALTPVVAFAVPSSRQAVLGLWQTGRKQVASGAGAVAGTVSDTARAGKRQVAGGVGSVSETVIDRLRSGRQQVAGQVEDVQRSRKAAQAREERRRAAEQEQTREQLYQAIKRLEEEIGKRDKRQGGFGRTLRRFTVGTLIGGGLGLLFAPQPGTATRARLRESTGGLQQRATQVTAQVREQAGTVAQQAQGTLSQVKEQAGTVAQQAQGALSQAKQQAQATTTSPFAAQIKEHMPVVGADGQPVGTVDHLDPGNTIKLTRDAQGQHHWIPLGWVARVDQQVRLSRPAQQARREWSTSAPQG